MGRHVLKVAEPQKALHTMKQQFQIKSTCEIELSYLSILLKSQKTGPGQGHLISQREHCDVFYIDKQDALILPKIEQILAADEAKLQYFCKNWQESINKLTEFSRQIRSMGLVAPDYQLDVISIENHNFPVLRISNTNQFLREDIPLFAPSSHHEARNERQHHQWTLDEHDWLMILSDVVQDIAVLVQHQIKIPKPLFDLAMFKGEKEDALRLFLAFDLLSPPSKRNSHPNQFFTGKPKDHLNPDNLIQLYIDYCFDSILEHIKQDNSDRASLIEPQLRSLFSRMRQDLFEQITTNVKNNL